MSTGGIFKLIINTGVQDVLLMASEYLSKRIQCMPCTTDIPLQTFVNSINKTHLLMTYGSYKPYVACGIEYNKVQAQGNIKYGKDVEFILPVFGDFINDCVIYVKLSKLKVVNPVDRVRYVAMIGHRMFKKLLLKVHANELDSYYTDDYNMFYEFQVPPSKQVGWLRDIGQQIPHAAIVTADPINDEYSEIKLITDGNQTFKREHNEVHMWIPLLFWFKDIQCSLPNSALPYGQTKVIATIADINELVAYADYGGGGNYVIPEIEVMELYMNNIFLNPEVMNLFLGRVGFSLIRVHGRHTELLKSSTESLRLNYLKWPTESIYVAFRPIKNMVYSQQWYKYCNIVPQSINVPVVIKTDIQLCYVNKTYEDLSLTVNTVILDADIDISNNYKLEVNGVNYIILKITNELKNIHTITIEGKWNDNVNDKSIFELYLPEIGINTATYYKEFPVIDTLKIEAHGITIFKELHESFYNSYLPYRFGKKINTPYDRGLYFANFNINPGEYQPSGHINLSRAREFYITYVSKFINTLNKCELIVNSSCINFLVVSDGSCILRYST